MTNQNYCPIHASLRNQTAPTETGTGVPLVTYVAILSEGLIYAEYEQCSTGTFNPVAHGFRLDRRNSPGRGQHLRGFGQIQAPPPPRHSHQAAGNWLDANASIGSAPDAASRARPRIYGNESGSKTASGQRFNQNAMTAAHRSLPFGTKLRVTHRGQSVVVTINDRGPFIRGRVLDLSKGAARAIGLTGAGVGHVTAEVVS